MYFDFEDYRPDISPVGRAISWREGILISIIVHLMGAVFLLMSPKLFSEDSTARARARQAALEERQRQAARFVFVQPRIDRPSPKPPPVADLSDLNRRAQSPEQAPKPTNTLPFSRGNTPERVEAEKRQQARGRGPSPEPAQGQQAQNTQSPAAATPSAVQTPDSTSALRLPSQQPPPQMRSGSMGRGVTSGGALGDALKNLQRYVQADQFENEGGTGQFGPAIQFDTKGVEFGPWIRRFIAQIKRNWFIPYAAMSMKGHVVVTFNVHKDGSISDLQVIGPCPIDAFNNAAFGALAASNPTQPLPPEYPSEHAFFTVTFFYNETPP